MTDELHLIGRLANRLLTLKLDTAAGEAGSARFVIQGLATDEVVSIVDAVVADEDLAPRLDVRLPEHVFRGTGVDENLLTDLAATELRHADCDREGRLLVLTDDSQQQSVAQVEKLDADTLLDEALLSIWIEEAGAGLALDESTIARWSAALKALLKIDRIGLRRTAAYLSAVGEALNRGETLTQAHGDALPVIGLPRHRTLFDDIPSAKLTWSSQWRARFESHWPRQNFMAKRDLKQIPFTRAILREKLSALSEALDPEVVRELDAYISAPDGTSAATLRLFDHDWSELSAFFDEAQKADKRQIGAETHAFYAVRPDLLLPDEAAYLDEFKERRPLANPVKQTQDEEFFARHADEMRDEPRLAALWERFIFGQKVECRDFLDGLIQCLRRTYQPGDSETRTLVVHAQEDGQSRFLPLNHNICTYFAAQYAGLPAAFDGLIRFESVEAFNYPDFAEAIKTAKRRTETSTSKRARQLNFRVWLESEGGDGVVARSAEIKLVWEGDPKWVGLTLADDMARLRDNSAKTPLIECAAKQVRSRGRGAGPNLRDISTFEPVGGRDRGTFVPRARPVSLTKAWTATLDDLVRQDLLTPTSAGELADSFAAFEAAYGQAIAEVPELGFAIESVQTQANRYSDLIVAIVERVSAPLALRRLLRPVLSIGVAATQGPFSGTQSAIVCPWQPLRLSALSRRWIGLRAHLERLLDAKPTVFTDQGGLFFNELRRMLAEPLGPEVAIAWHADQPELLALSSAVNDYSLHEPPVSGREGGQATGDNVGPVAREIGDLVQSYLHLQPHEADNLSVVLYNCDAAALPQAVVDVIREQSDTEDGDATCQVKLRHRDDAKLRNLYGELVKRDAKDDGLHASEATRDFMARMRISILVNEAPALSAGDPPEDIVFCHDVISRAAEIDWDAIKAKLLSDDEVDLREWSRRKPVGRGDLAAMVYLASPAQTTIGQTYLDALAHLFEPKAAQHARSAGQLLMPVRKTDLLDKATQEILEETHRLGAWVVNFDDLLDRRQLANSQIRIIRYKYAASGGRNLIISSKAPDAFLRATLRTRIRTLDPSYDEAELDSLATRLIENANQISGDIVLRAAKRGNNANELIGVVLSRFLVQAELDEEQPAAWIFLDDYAAWLGQSEKQIADLLCMSPSYDSHGVLTVDLVVTEAKFVAAAGAAAKEKESQRQLRDTLRRLERALNADQPPADHFIWCARLSDMLRDALRDPAGPPINADPIIAAVRAGDCRFRVRGYSHVFAHAAPNADVDVADRMTGVVDTDNGAQEVYGPQSLRQVLKAYFDGTDPSDIRQKVRGGTPPGPGDSRESVPAESAPPLPPGGAAPEDQPFESEQATPQPGAPLSTEVEPAPETPTPPATSLPRFRARLLASMTDHPPGAEGDAWLAEVSTRCRNALRGYGMTSELKQAVLTPNAALLKFRGTDSLTVASVERKLRELESTHGLSVLNVRSEPGLVSISIQRLVRDVLTIGEVWKDWATDPTQPNTRLLIGVKEDDGKPLYLEPQPAPHTLVAGSTGSGKSVLLQSIILGIAATNRPDQALIHLIDPKSGVDYYAFEPLPHLVDGIVDTPEAALERLDGLVEEMERRYSLFRGKRAVNIQSYNQKVSEPLPLLWLVHDEFADWMQIESYRAGVEAAVSRLSVKARAAGIYLIFAAQRPDNTVFPMQLRSNLGNRLVLRVDSAGTSDLSLGVRNGAAERLLGKGHLAAVLGGGSTPIYAQVPFVDEEELIELVEALCEDLASA